jgi:hypothetical protein
MDQTKYTTLPSWSPNPSDLEGLSNLLRQSQIPDKEQQVKVYASLTELSKNNEFYLYLVVILSDGAKELNVRQIAGKEVEKKFRKHQL